MRAPILATSTVAVPALRGVRPLAPSVEVRRAIVAPPVGPRTAAADVVLPCDQSDLAAAGGDPSRLRLARVADGGRLLLVPTSVEPGCQLRGYAADADQLVLVAFRGRPAQLDYPTAPDAHFFTETGGAPGFAGYVVADDAEAPMLSEMRRLGGVERLGYPMAGRLTLDGFAAQVTERAVLQWLPDRGEAHLVPLMDLLNAQGYDRALNDFWSIPPIGSTANDADPAAVTTLNAAAADGAYGEPTAMARYADRIVLRTRTTVLQYWLVETPFAHPGEVTVADVGTISVALGLWPADATTPQVAPAPAAVVS